LYYNISKFLLAPLEKKKTQTVPIHRSNQQVKAVPNILFLFGQVIQTNYTEYE